MGPVRVEQDCLGQVTIEIPQTFHQFVDGALLRLQAQYPRLRFKSSSAGVETEPVTAADLDELRRNVFHAVYREKIYVETLPLRQSLIKAVTAK
jgi:hypothetical protein